MSEFKGGRGKSRLKEELQNALSLAKQFISSKEEIPPAKQRLLTDQIESLTKLYELECDEKRDKLSEQIKALQVEVERLTQENATLREQPAVVVNSSSTDSFLSSQVDKLRGQLDGALIRCKQLASELSSAKHNAEREVAALQKELEDLRGDAAYGRQVRKEKRIEELRKKVAEYDARLLLPNCGIDPRMGKAQFESLMATEKAVRDELDSLLGVSRREAKKIPLPPDIAEHRAEQRELAQQWNEAYTRSAAEAEGWNS